MAKVARLEHEILIVEEQSDAVGCVITLGLHFLVGEEDNVGVGAAKQRDQLFPYRASQFAAVELLELHGIGKPANRIPEGSDRELDQHFAVVGRKIVTEH